MTYQLREAIARVTIEGKRIRGSAFLVSGDLCATALHVVADRHTDPPKLHGDITLWFPSGGVEAKLEKWNNQADLALLRCNSTLDFAPIGLQDLQRSGAEWESYGFPDANPGGMTVAGRVRDANATLNGATGGFAAPISVLQLYCMEAAAGNGMPVSGLSGAPVIVGDRAVGMLRYALMRQSETLDGRPEQTAVAGTIYACKASMIASAHPTALPLIPAVGPGLTISFAVPEGMTFRDVAGLLGRHVRRNVVLQGFSENELSAPLKQHELACRDIREALHELGALALALPIREYQVVEEAQRIILKAVAS
jgi:hypothetical protein